MKVTQLISDPSSGDLSMSRLGLGLLLMTDIAWVLMCMFGYPQPEYVNPVCTMLATITGGVCGIYGANSFAGSWKRSVVTAMDFATGDEPPDTNRPKVKPKKPR